MRALPRGVKYDTFYGFVVGALLVGFCWFGMDGHRRELPKKHEPLQNIDRFSFDAGVLCGSVAEANLTATPPFTNADVLITRAWYEWTNNARNPFK